MAYIDIDIEDHLGEVDTSDLIRELEDRTIFPKDRKRLITALKLTDSEFVEINSAPTSLRDVIKIEAFYAKYKDVPEADLDEFLNKY